MKKLLISFLCVLSVLTLLSCSQDVTTTQKTSVNGLTTKNIVAGAVYDGSKIVAFQVLGFIENNSSETKESISIRVDWEDSSGRVLKSDNYSILSLAPGKKCPIWIYHSSSSDISTLNSFSKVTINYLSASNASGMYTTDFIFNDIVFSSSGDCTRVTGKLVNNSSMKVGSLCIEAGSVSSAGKCVEYGIDILRGEVLSPGQSTTFDFTFCLPIGTPSTTYFYCSGKKVT